MRVSTLPFARTFTDALRRNSSADQTARRSSSSRTLHSAISASVRKQPVHRPLSGSIAQTLMQGDGTRSLEVCVVIGLDQWNALA